MSLARVTLSAAARTLARTGARAATALPSSTGAKHQGDICTKLARSGGEVVVILRIRAFARVAARSASNSVDAFSGGTHTSSHERRESLAGLAIPIHATPNVGVDIGNIKVLKVRRSDLELGHRLGRCRVEVCVLVGEQLGAATSAISSLGIDGHGHGRRGSNGRGAWLIVEHVVDGHSAIILDDLIAPMALVNSARGHAIGRREDGENWHRSQRNKVVPHLCGRMFFFLGNILKNAGVIVVKLHASMKRFLGFDDVLIIAVLIKGVWARYCVEQCIASRRSRQLGKGA